MSAKAIGNISARMVKASKELYEHGLVRGTSGNISARIPGTDTFLIKPSGVYMGLLKPEELVLLDFEGNKIRGKRHISAETPMHVAIYRARKDVQAVVHTHAPTATAFGIAGIEIFPLQIETFMLLPRGVPIVPFESPGSKALAETVQRKIADYDAVILENHGIVTVGSTIKEACNLNEMVEEAAKIQFTTGMLAGKDAVSWAELKKKFKPQNTMK
jgi:L-fuculose-phosphate aldolase